LGGASIRPRAFRPPAPAKVWYSLRRLHAAASPIGKTPNLPLLLVNFKTYPETRGERAVRLTRTASKVAHELSASIAVAPGPLDLARVVEAADIPVFAQHTDPRPSGQHTGAVTADYLKALGVTGTLLNHSEKRLHFGALESARALCGRAGLVTVICAGTVAQAKRVASLKSEFVAIEPPDLIGGEVSVSTARPSVISKGVEAVRAVSPHTAVLCGAGVKRREDVARALELGASGVLLASGVTLAKDPSGALYDLASGLQARA
jgi:triosephosphate isomerase